MCGCGKETVVVPYLTRRGMRRQYLACTHCDRVDLWPNFTRASPNWRPAPKTAPRE